MAPIRRYLRITKYSVLEVRIYLDKPSDAAWLLSSRDPVLPRILQAVRPKVLPKLREERENAKKKGGKKKKGIKDVVSQEDFEVSIFLKETSTRHALLTKYKDFKEKPRLQSTGNKLINRLNGRENAILIDDEDQPPAVLREENDDELPELVNIPEAEVGTKRKPSGRDDGDDEALFVSSGDETARAPAPKRRKRGGRRDRGGLVSESEAVPEEEEAEDDKKKLALGTSYNSFSLYGRILCLIVTRKAKKSSALTDAPAVGGSQMMERWVSTQAAQENHGLDGDDDDG